MVRDITFHYTSEEMAKDLINLLPIKNKVCLDAGSGKNKVWFNNLPTKTKFECELEDGVNFYDWDKEVDWVIGNPPYHESWKFTEHAISIAVGGVAWLLNNQALNSHFTPKRIEWLAQQGFYYSKIVVVSDKRWFGRYYFVVLEKIPNNFISTIRKNY